MEKYINVNEFIQEHFRWEDKYGGLHPVDPHSSYQVHEIERMLNDFPSANVVEVENGDTVEEE